MLCEKDKLFQLMQSNPIKKNFFQHTTTPTSHCNKANEQSHISSATTYCELAVHLFFFEKTSVLRLHYGNPFAPIQSLYAAVLWAKPVSARAAGKFYKIFSGRALNRPRSPEVRKPLVYFWYFSYTRKVRKTFLSQEAPRFCKPRISTPKQQLRTATIKTFSRKPRDSANLKSAHRSRSFAQCAYVQLFYCMSVSAPSGGIPT